MQTAREAPGDYGSKSGRGPMAFDVVETNEAGDYYLVTLSFRPQGDFTGVAGQEQFFIDKDGRFTNSQEYPYFGKGSAKAFIFLVDNGEEFESCLSKSPPS